MGRSNSLPAFSCRSCGEIGRWANAGNEPTKGPREARRATLEYLFQQMRNLPDAEYTNNLKSWNFGKELPEL